MKNEKCKNISPVISEVLWNGCMDILMKNRWISELFKSKIISLNKVRHTS